MLSQIFPVNQKIRRVEQLTAQGEREAKDNANNHNDQNDPNSAINYLDNKIQLISDFGTLKSKKVASSIKSNIVKEGNISSVNAAKNILEDIAIEQDKVIKKNEKEELESKLDLWKNILPEFDLNAKKRDEIFLSNAICDDEVFEKIDEKPLINILINDSIFQQSSNKFTEFVYDYLKKIVRIVKNGRTINNKLKFALLLDKMIKIHLLPDNIRHSVDIIARDIDTNPEIVTFLLDNFTETIVSDDNIKRIKSKIYKLKLIYHIIILAFLINSCEYNFTKLASSMKIEIKEMHKYFKEIGCKILTENAYIKLKEKSKSKEEKVDDKNNPNQKKIKDISKECWVILEAPLKLNLNLNNKFAKK